MNTSDRKVAVIGAGMSGLTAARRLESKGFLPIIFESSSKIGGRLKSEKYEDVYLDRGFQILLTAYPMVKKYLDLDALELIPFTPGALIAENGKFKKWGDPLRDQQFLLPTLFSSMATIKDKWLIYQLRNQLKQRSPAEIFETSEMQSTRDYLNSKGFSASVIHHFFQPFFAGVFLETGLDTPHVQFLFTFKMFAEGMAALPKFGIQAVPRQIADQLQQSRFHLNTPVAEIQGNEITLKNGDQQKFRKILLCTSPDFPIDGKKRSSPQWKTVRNLYFSTKQPDIRNATIAIVPGNHPVNNFHIVPAMHGINAAERVLSVSLIDASNHPVEEAIDYFASAYGWTDLQLIKDFRIPAALPMLDAPTYAPLENEIQINTTLYQAGDHLCNGSLNGAMISGERAADMLIRDMLQEEKTSPNL